MLQSNAFDNEGINYVYQRKDIISEFNKKNILECKVGLIL